MHLTQEPAGEPGVERLVRTMVFMVLGAKGGVGKTVFAEMLARTLAELGTTALIDGSTTNPNTDDHYRGLLEDSPQRVRTLADDVAGAAQWWQHPTTQMLLVPGDRRPGNRSAEALRRQLERALGHCRGVLDYVVIDAGHFADNGLIDWIVAQADRAICLINHEPDSRSGVESWLVDQYVVHQRVSPSVFGAVYSPRSGEHPLQVDAAQLDVAAWNERIRAERPDLRPHDEVEWLGTLPYSRELEHLVLEGILGESLLPYEIEVGVHDVTARLLRTDQLPISRRQPPHRRPDPTPSDRVGLAEWLRQWIRPSRQETGEVCIDVALGAPPPRQSAVVDAPPLPHPSSTIEPAAPAVSQAAPSRLELHVFGVPRLVGGQINPGVARNIVAYLAAFGPTPRQALARPCGFTPASIRTHLSTLRTTGLIETVDELVMLPNDLWVDLRVLTSAQQKIVAGAADPGLVDETLDLLSGLEGHVFESDSKRDWFGWREIDESTVIFDVENLVVQTIDNIAGQWCDWPPDRRAEGARLIEVFTHVQERVGLIDPWMIGQAMASVVAEEVGLRQLFDRRTGAWSDPPDHVMRLLATSDPYAHG